MMIASRPIRFVVGIVALWTGARAWMLWPQIERGVTDAVRAVASGAPAIAGALPAVRSADRPGSVTIALGPMIPLPAPTTEAADSAPPAPDEPPLLLAAATPGNIAPPLSAPPPAASAPQALGAAPAATSRWSGSAWVYGRDSGGDGLATGGQLGGSQAGARILFRPVPSVPVALAMRVSRPLEDKGAEAAIGVDWQPIPAIRFAVERRMKLERGGRNAWSAFAAGGVYDRHVAGLRVDAYAQAGVVGARRRDLFADGGIRVGREIGRVTIGAGAWGAAQPKVTRIDIGPQAVARVPVAGTTLSAAADWRFRIAGNARPGSGPAITLGLDF
jgi:hypothetical protein